MRIYVKLKISLNQRNVGCELTYILAILYCITTVLPPISPCLQRYIQYPPICTSVKRDVNVIRYGRSRSPLRSRSPEFCTRSVLRSAHMLWRPILCRLSWNLPFISKHLKFLLTIPKTMALLAAFKHCKLGFRCCCWWIDKSCMKPLEWDAVCATEWQGQQASVYVVIYNIDESVAFWNLRTITFIELSIHLKPLTAFEQICVTLLHGRVDVDGMVNAF